MNGLPYYKAFPRDFFDGTVGLDFEVKAAYRLLLDLIYQHGGRLYDDQRFIAGQMGCSVKKWNGLRAAILATGKITVSEGYLGNLRADKELDSLKSFRETQRKNGSVPKKNKDLTEAMAKPEASHTDTDTDTERGEGKPSLALVPKPSRFEEFWNVYPHRGGVKRDRKHSQARYAAQVKAGTPEQDIIDGAKRAGNDRRVRDGFARDPTTWLNAEGWNDEIDTSTNSAPKGNHNDRAKFDRTILQLADSLNSGTAYIDNSSSDPFISLARRNAEKG